MNGTFTPPPHGGYDVVIRTQEEFDALLASPTWFDARSVLFVGDGGTLKFTSPDIINIPLSVKCLQGIGAATINVTAFIGLTYGTTLSNAADYYMRDITLKCDYLESGASSAFGMYGCHNIQNCTVIVNSASASAIAFAMCNNIINCIGEAMTDGISAQAFAFGTCLSVINCTARGRGNGLAAGFNSCENLINCAGVGTHSGPPSGNAYSFNSCSYLNNCRQGGSQSTNGFLGGTNRRVDTLTVMAYSTSADAGYIY